MIIYSRTISKLVVSSYIIFCRDFEKETKKCFDTYIRGSIYYVM